MKMKKMLATVMATALAVTMIPFAAFAQEDPVWDTNGGTETIPGEGTVRQPIIEVTLPGDLAFEVDGMKLNGGKHEIYGGDYNIINRSEVPVKVTVKPYIDLEGQENLEVISSNNLSFANNNRANGYAPVSSNTATNRVVAISAVAADKTPTAAYKTETENYTFSYSGNGNVLGRGVLSYDTTTGALKYSEVSIPADSADNTGIIDLKDKADDDVKLEFVLGPTKYDSETGANKGIGDTGSITSGYENTITSFTFVGAVDPRKTYFDGEINVKAVFKMYVVPDDYLAHMTYSGTQIKTASGYEGPAANNVPRQQLIATDANKY